MWLNPEKEAYIRNCVAYPLRFFCQQFRSGELHGENVGNVEEAHFVIHIDNGRYLSFCGSEEVKWADVVTGAEWMTMVVRKYGGRDAQIEPEFIYV